MSNEKSDLGTISDYILNEAPIQIVKDSHGHYRKGNSIFGDCEVCDATDIEITIHYGNMWFCKSCWDSEVKHKESNITEVQQVNTLHKVNHDVVAASRMIDGSMQVRPDLFNAETVAIIDLKAAIDNDPTIENKPYKLAEELMNRLTHAQKVIFEHNEAIVAETNKQKAIQIYLNTLANTLRLEEREKLKIQDINYKPGAIKSVKPKAISTTGTKKTGKLDKVELRKYASMLGIPEFTLQMLVVSKGVTIETAYNMLKKSIDAGKSQS